MDRLKIQYKEFTLNPLIGKKVICRSKKNEPFFVAILKTLDNSCQFVPVVEIDKKLIWHQGLIILWSQYIENYLITLDYQKQWDYLYGFIEAAKLMNK